MTISAIAAVSRVPGGDFSIEPVELDRPRNNEILVRIKGAGLCHTDLFFNAVDVPMPAPRVFGHEGAGIVEQVGADVTKVAVGDHVVLTFSSCGSCATCDRDEPAYCANFARQNLAGRRPDGSSAMSVDGAPASAHFFGQSSFATYAIADERNAIPIDPAAPLEFMGALGCGVQTGVGAVTRSLACRSGSSLVILGGGAVGLSAVLGAVIQGCAFIVVVEPHHDRRLLALELGATHVIAPGVGDVSEQIKAILPDGAQFALDTTGNVELIAAVAGCFAPHGRFGLVGLAKAADAVVPVPLNGVIASGISLIGIMEGDSLPQQFIPELVDLFLRGDLPFDRLISMYRFEDINKAVADQRAGQCVKAVMLMS